MAVGERDLVMFVCIPGLHLGNCIVHLLFMYVHLVCVLSKKKEGETCVCMHSVVES